MQSEWIIGFFIVLIIIQLFMLMGLNKNRRIPERNYKNKKCNKCSNCFKEFYSADPSVTTVLQQIYNNNVNKYLNLYRQNTRDVNLKLTLSQIVSAGEKIGKSKEDIKNQLVENGVNGNDISF